MFCRTNKKDFSCVKIFPSNLFSKNNNHYQSNVKVTRNRHINRTSTTNSNQRRKPKYTDEIQRLRTFATFPRLSFLEVSVILLAEDGFVFTGYRDTTRCAFCGVVKSSWTSQDDIHQVHASMSPSCPMVTRTDCNNKTIQPDIQSNCFFLDVSPSNHTFTQCVEHNRNNVHYEDDHSMHRHYHPLDNSKNCSLEIQSQNGGSLANDEPAIIKMSPSHSPSRHNAENKLDHTSLSEKVTRSDYAAEDKRLESFAKWPKDHHLNPYTLAKSGLFYAGYGDCVRCFTCGGGLRNWNLEDDIWVEHARWFPKCKYIIDTLGPPFIAVVSDLNTNHDKIDLNMILQKLSEDYCEHFPVLRELWLTTYGKKQISSSNVQDELFEKANEKQEYSIKNGPFQMKLQDSEDKKSLVAARTASNIIKKTEDSSYLGVITDTPKTIELSSWSKRLTKFEKWPQDHHLKPQMLCDAGFSYAGYGDCCRCFYCGGGLRNWEKDDDVWVEHARWFPNCGYMKQKAGDVFITAVQKLNKTKDKITIGNILAEIGESNLMFHRDVMFKNNPSVVSVIKRGYEEDVVLDVAKAVYDTRNEITSENLTEKLNELGKVSHKPVKTISKPSQDNIEAIRKENKELREQSLCKICLDQKMEIVFKSCGHLVSCVECAAALVKCPICRKTIEGKVRVQME